MNLPNYDRWKLDTPPRLENAMPDDDDDDDDSDIDTPLVPLTCCDYCGAGTTPVSPIISTTDNICETCLERFRWFEEGTSL